MNANSKTFRLSGCLVTVLSLAFGTNSALAKVSEEVAAQLGMAEDNTPLTPMGAIRVGTDDGTIPAWTGGITEPPANWKPGTWYTHPFPDDKPLFTITAENYRQYEEHLGEGNIALFKQYPDTYKMHVYQSRRSASMPQRIYEGSMHNASHTTFCEDSSMEGGINTRCLNDSWEDFQPGVAFPIPNTGAEAMWNHTNYYFGDHSIQWVHGFNVTEGGSISHNSRTEWTIYPYYWEKERQPTHPYFKTENSGRALWCLGYYEAYPPQSAGRVIGGCSRTKDTDFDAYLYLPGQRRVRKAPEIGFYDSPGSGSDGIRTADQRFLFAQTGTVERYNFDTPVRTIKYIPYNNYQLTQEGLSLEDVVLPGHSNPDMIRWELQRVWRIEAKIKPGHRHLAPHRIIYVDQDSWVAGVGIMYDQQDNLWRASESYNLNFYDVPMVSFWGDAHMDLQARRWATVQGWYNMDPGGNSKMPDFTVSRDPNIFTPSGLRAQGTR